MRSSPPFKTTDHSESTSLSGLILKRIQKLLLADSAIRVLVHGLEVLLELLLIKRSIWLDSFQHTNAEGPHLTLLQSAVLVGVNAREKLLSSLHELVLTHLCHSLCTLNFKLIDCKHVHNKTS